MERGGRKLQTQVNDRRTSSGNSMGKKFSANQLIRSAGNSVEKRLTPEKKGGTKKEKAPTFAQITIITYNQKTPSI